MRPSNSARHLWFLKGIFSAFHPCQGCGLLPEQLFGEIGEYFAIPPRADLSLDEFPTLRHVLEFLVAETAA